MKVCSPSAPTGASYLLQLLLAPLATNSQGQKEELVPGSKDEACLPHHPFIAPRFGTWSSPGSPGPSLVVLFSMACPSSGPLPCGLTLSKTVSQTALIAMVVLWFFPSSWLGSWAVLSLELFSLESWPLAGLVFQIPWPPCSAEVSSQMPQSSEV